MINKTDFYSWQKQATKLDRVRFGGKASPNVLAIKEYVLKRWGGRNLGLVNKRKVRGGEELSSHYYGAAWDWGYNTRARAETVMNYLVNNSNELGVQMIVDYVGSRIWTSKNGWYKAKPSKSGMGTAWAKWIHVETTKTMWGNNTPVSDRVR
jgi:hypothetical protein